MDKNNKLQVIMQEQGLDKADVTKLVEAFGGPFEEAGTILATYKDIVVTDVNDHAGMGKAREARLLLKKARTTVENSRKELKSDIVKQGRAIDSVAKFVKEEIEPAEQYLELQEKFAEIQKAKAVAELKAKRIEQLNVYTSDLSVYNLDNMTEESFNTLLAQLKAVAEAEAKRIADEAKAKEEAEKAEAKRVADQAKENARLKAEAEARDKREAEEKAEREKAEQARQAEQDKKDAEAKAEQDRIQAEADAKVAKEREAREKLEREQRERDEAEIEARKAKEIADNIAKVNAEEAERQKLLAPDKVKLHELGQQIESLELPAVKSNKAQEVVTYIEEELKRLANYANGKAKEL